MQLIKSVCARATFVPWHSLKAVVAVALAVLVAPQLALLGHGHRSDRDLRGALRGRRGRRRAVHAAALQ